MTATHLASRESLEAFGLHLPAIPWARMAFSRRWIGRRGMASRPTGPAARKQARRQAPAAAEIDILSPVPLSPVLHQEKKPETAFK